MCDLDFIFKSVNDTHGHGGGDDVLLATAQALQRTRRSSDRVAQFGGEEFVVLLSETELTATGLRRWHLPELVCKAVLFHHWSLDDIETQVDDRELKAILLARRKAGQLCQPDEEEAA